MSWRRDTKRFDEMVEAAYRENVRKGLFENNLPKDWDTMSFEKLAGILNDPSRRPTPQVTVEAIMFSVRERGLAALQEPDTIERLSRCDEAAQAQINKRIDAMLKGSQ